MKKIWIFNHYAVPPSIPGGTRHYDFAFELVKRGYDVTIFASSYIHGKGIELLSDEEEYRENIYNGVRFIWIKTPSYSRNDLNRIKNMLVYAIKIYRLTKDFSSPNVIIGSSVHPFTCIAAYYISRRYRCRYISEIRDLWPQTLIDMGKMKKTGISARFFYILERFIYKKSHKIIVLLPGAKKYIVKLGIDEKKIYCIPNGVNIKEFDKIKNISSEEVKDIMNNNSNKFICLYAGAHGEANYLDNIIKAAKIIQDKEISDIRFVLVGDGPEKEKLVAFAKDINLENVYFHNPINKENIPLLVSSSDVNIFNLKDIDVFKYGISSNKLFDYLCSGKPMVFACKCSNDIIENSNSGISIQPENPEAMANAIIKLYNMDKKERARLGENGINYMKEHHDIPVLVDELEKLFY